MRHISVLKHIIEDEIQKTHGNVIDCTFGFGGHILGIKHIIERFGFEIDRKYFLFCTSQYIYLFNKCFTEIDKINFTIYLAIIDVGFSSNQLINSHVCGSYKSMCVGVIRCERLIRFASYKVRNLKYKVSSKLEVILRKCLRVLRRKGKAILLCYNFLEISNVVFFLKHFRIFFQYQSKKQYVTRMNNKNNTQTKLYIIKKL